MYEAEFLFPFYNHGQHLRILLTIGLLAMAALIWAPSVSAASIEALAGRSVTTQQRWTDTVFITTVGNWRALGASGKWRWAPEAGLGWFKARSDNRENLDHATLIVYGGARLGGWWRQAFVGFGVGLTKYRSAALSSPYEFVSSLGWQGQHYVLMLRHISNARLHRPNLGETMLLVGLRF